MARSQWLVALARGIRERSSDFRFDGFASQVVPIPPYQEQDSLASFVSSFDRRISRVIRAKRRLIELLNEQKQNIVNQAVTRGLDPSVRLKFSGIEWLGDVPEHWEISRVKNEFECLDTRRVPLSGPERGRMTTQLYDYYGASGVIDKVEDYLFDDELILLAEDGANLVLRNLPLAIIARGKFWVNNHAHVLKPTRGSLDYFAQLLECIDYRPWITGAAQPKLTGDRLRAIAIPAPPVHEQYRIVEQTNGETAAMRSSIERTRREIDLLREYRTRLIADVVTGKLDVRAAAASLPEQADESETFEDAPADGDEAAQDLDPPIAAEKDAL